MRYIAQGYHMEDELSSNAADCAAGICDHGQRDAHLLIGHIPWVCHCGWAIMVDADESGPQDDRLLGHRAEHKAAERRGRVATV